jgi:hypothetical protein
MIIDKVRHDSVVVVIKLLSVLIVILNSENHYISDYNKCIYATIYSVRI